MHIHIYAYIYIYIYIHIHTYIVIHTSTSVDYFFNFFFCIKSRAEEIEDTCLHLPECLVPITIIPCSVLFSRTKITSKIQTLAISLFTNSPMNVVIANTSEF